MKTKIKRWMSMAMACFVLLSCIIPVYADEPQTIDRSAAATLPLEWEQEESEEITPATQQDEEQGEDIPAEALTQPEGFDPAEAESDTPVSELPPEPEGETAAEKCVAYEHLSDAEGHCTLCGTDLIAEFTALYHSLSREEYIAKMNAWGWYEQNATSSDAALQAESEAMALFDIATAAVDVYSCFELALADGVSEELYNKLLDLYAMNEAAQLAYRYPQNPDIFDEPDTELEDDSAEDSEDSSLTDDILFRDLPDAPTGSYMTSRGLPVPTGETKISISGWRNDLLGKEYFDVAALNAGSSTITVAKESGKDYAIVPILTQVEYPANGSSAVVTLPEGVEVLSFDKAEPASPSLRNSILNQSYHETAAVISGFFVRATADFTATFTYSDPDGNSQSQTLTVRIGEGSDQQLQKMVSDYRASTMADRPTPSQLTGRITQVSFEVDTWLIWFNGEEAYCCSHGLNGRPNGCPLYNYSHTSVITADQYVGTHYGNQVSIWGGLGQLSLNTMVEQHSDSFADSVFHSSAATYSLDEEALLEYCYKIYSDSQMYIITRYPDSAAARIYLESARQAMRGVRILGDGGYYTYIYNPSASGWQVVALLGPATDEAGEGEADPEYYASWSAPAQTVSGSFDFTYKVNTDKYGLDTKEKVDGAVIDIEPTTKSGSIEGGSWSISPADKQTVVTSGHTADEDFHRNGGAGSASWALHYEVSKTSGTRSGSVGPYSSQSEADSAAASAQAAAEAELRAEAQAAVNAAIATAKNRLNTLTFTYNETDMPHGFDSYTGENGSTQTIAVAQGTDKTYPMVNDEWSMKISIDKVDSETGNRIAGDAEFQVFQWDTVAQMYLPYGGYNQYKIERKADGTYGLVNHFGYAATAEHKESLFYTQRNEGKVIIVETKAPAGYYGDWSDPDHPGDPNTPCGKRGYFIEVTKEKDGTVLPLGNTDYNADIGLSDNGGIQLKTAEGKIVSVHIGQYKDSTRTLNADPSGLANNEDSYTMHPTDGVFQNNRVLGQIVLSKVDLDAMKYLTPGCNGASTLEGAVYDLYCAEDIHHPDGVFGVVDYSKIVDTSGSPIWHTTVLTNSGWDFSYLPILKKDRLAASAEIKDGKLVFAGLYLGEYYLVERATGIVLPVDTGNKFYLTGSYPALNSKLQPNGSYNALAKSGGKYTDYAYKNRYSFVAEGRALDGRKTYDGYYLSFAEGYLCDEVNHYEKPSYADESIYINSVEDTSTDEVLKSGFAINKVVSTTGERAPAFKLEGAGFTVYRIDLLSKADHFKQNANGSYDVQSILDAYRKDSYDQDTLKYDFSREGQAIATMYESDLSAVESYNALLTADMDNASGKGAGWQPTGTPDEYRLGEVFSNEDGILRVEGLPYGSWLVVETTIPKDVFQCDPFIVTVDSSSPQSRFSVPSGSVTTPSSSYMTFNILNEELEGYLQLAKIDLETGKPVKAANMAFSIYYLDESGHYRLDKDGNPRPVEMHDPASGNVTAKTTVFYTDSEGTLKTPDKLPLGRYRVVELESCSGYYNEWIDTAFYRSNGVLSGDGLYYVDFEVTSDRAYEVIGESADDMDDYIVRESYYNSETLGQVTIRKEGKVLAGYENGQFVYETRSLAGAVFQITAKEDIPTQDRQGTYWYKAGDIVATVTTGEDGQVDEVAFAPTRTSATYDFLHITYDGSLGEVSVTLPLGNYSVREITAPYGFILTEKSYDFTLSWSKQTDDIVLANSINAHTQQDMVSHKYGVVRVKDASPELLKEQKLVFENARVLPVPQTPGEQVTQIGVGIYKRDRETDIPLAGAVYELYTSDAIFDVDGNKLAEAGQLLATSAPTDDTGFAWFPVDVPIRSEKYATAPNTNSGNYIIVEKAAPAGYLLDSTPLEVSFTYEGQTIPWQVVDATNTNLRTTVHISKQDITNCEELPGASLTISTEDGTIVESWVSSNEPHPVRGLELGKAYILTEVQPAPGFAVAESIVFKLEQSKDENGNILQSNDVFVKDESGEWIRVDAQTVVMLDAPALRISKTDVGGVELPGAKLTIFTEDGTVVDSWTSGNTPHDVCVAPADQAKEGCILFSDEDTEWVYLLHEDAAPAGYLLATTIQFIVRQDDNGALLVYTRTKEAEDWTLVNGNTLTMVDELAPKPQPVPDNTPKHDPEPAPDPTPVPVTVFRKGNAPKTGDSSRPVLWALTAAVSLACLVAVHRKWKSILDDEETEADTEEDSE